MRNLARAVGLALLCAVHAVKADHGGGHGGGGGDDGKAKVSYKVATTDYPGFQGTTTLGGLSDSGQVVGSFTTAAGQFGYGFVETRGRFSLLPVAPCQGTRCDTTPLAVNTHGVIAGEFSEDAAHRGVFVIRNNILRTVSVPGALDLAIFTGLNERGDVVGFFQAGNGLIRTFVETDKALTVLPVPAGVVDMAGRGINGSGQITGSFDDATGLHGFLQSGPQFRRFDVPGATATSPLAINQSGDIVGTFSEAAASATPVQHGFLLMRGKLTRLDFPGGLNTNPVTLNDSDTVVGTYVDSASKPPFNSNAFVYQQGRFIKLALPGAVESVGGINSSGEVAGTYFDAGCPVSCSVHGFTATSGDGKDKGDGGHEGHGH
jgi:hypothetical protein